MQGGFDFTIPAIDTRSTSPTGETVNELRDQALTQVAVHAEQHRAHFSADAQAFVLTYLRQGPASGEVITLACKQAGIVPHDDRAFGTVYMSLAKRGLIEKVGMVRRERGHGTAGGNVWALRKG